MISEDGAHHASSGAGLFFVLVVRTSEVVQAGPQASETDECPASEVRGRSQQPPTRPWEAKGTTACTHKIAIGGSDLINVRLAHFADSSRTSPEVREVAKAVIRNGGAVT